MRTLVLSLVALVAVSATAEAASRHKGKQHWKRGAYVERNYEGSYRSQRRFTKREYDRLPIRITKPDNMRHYVYQDYPAWAAEAMQPKKWW